MHIFYFSSGKIVDLQAAQNIYTSGNSVLLFASFHSKSSDFRKKFPSLHIDSKFLLKRCGIDMQVKLKTKEYAIFGTCKKQV